MIEFFVDVPGETAAENCASAINKAEFRSRIEFDEGEPDFDSEIDDADEFGPSWTVCVDVQMVPDYNDIIQLQAELERITQPFSGKLDGWGIMFAGDDPNAG